MRRTDESAKGEEHDVQAVQGGRHHGALHGVRVPLRQACATNRTGCGRVSRSNIGTEPARLASSVSSSVGYTLSAFCVLQSSMGRSHGRSSAHVGT